MTEPENRSELEHCAGAKIESGELPTEFRGHTRAGAGTGAHCDLCAQVIEKSKIEYEVDWHRTSGTRVLRFHLDCFQAWVCSIRDLPG
jgi:hypothetical protein